MSTIEDKSYLLERINKMYLSKDKIENKQYNLTKENLEKIKKLKDIHSGERCFIIGGSPSLKELDLTKLNNEYTFTMNRGYKLTDFGLTHATYHIFSDPETFSEDKIENEIPRNWADKFFVYGGIKFPFKENVIFYDWTFSPSTHFEERFTADLTQPIMCCSTTAIHAIQIATYMGFDKMYLVGIDMDYNNNQGHIYSQTVGEGRRQNRDNRSESINFALNCIGKADKYLNKINKKIYNASPKGIVDCIERVDYNEVLNA